MLWIFFIPSLFYLTFSCGFQQLKHPPLQYINTTSSRPKNERMLQQTYENIRIYADYSSLQTNNFAQRDYIQNHIMPSALSYYQTTLQIIRETKSLLINTECAGYSPSPFFSDLGVDTDLVLLVVAENMPNETFVAAAVPCGLSLTDNRPVYGLMMFNLAYLPMETVADHQENLSTALHEICHVLGFNSDLYSYFFNPQTGERLSNILGTIETAGGFVYFIDVEPLTSRLRAYFSCDSLEGAYLEDEGGTGTAGSHFERRIFMNEFMTASSITDPVISEFTLALLEGSGWYRPHYNMTEPFNWGRGQGCKFLNSSCIDSQGVPRFYGFCDGSVPIGCSFTSRGTGFCGTGLYTDFFANGCPYYMSSAAFDCENPDNQGFALLSAATYSPSSRCFTGTLVDSTYQPTYGAYCFTTICTTTETGFNLTLTINDNTINCASAGPISIEGFNGQLDCPDPNEFCVRANPVFCEKGCAGRGTCVDSKCQCPPGWGGADCAERVFNLPCERCQNSTEFGCYGDRCLGLLELGLDSLN